MKVNMPIEITAAQNKHYIIKVNITEQIYKSMDEIEVSLLVLLDLSKAIDKCKS